MPIILKTKKWIGGANIKYLIAIFIIIAFVYKENLFSIFSRKSRNKIKRSSLEDKILQILKHKEFIYVKKGVINLIIYGLFLSMVPVAILTNLLIAVIYIFFMSLFVLLGIKIYLNHKENLVKEFFPVAISIFQEKYNNTRNIKLAISQCSSRVPKELKFSFNKLSRNLSVSKNISEELQKFSDSFDDIWVNAFKNFLVSSLDGTNDIRRDLVNLNEAINEDNRSKREENSHTITNKLIFLFLFLATVIAVILSCYYNPIILDILIDNPQLFIFAGIAYSIEILLLYIIDVI